MKSLVVYYSLDGHTRRAADIIARETGSDVHELRPLKSTGKSGFAKYFLGGMRANFGLKSKLRDPLPELSSYDRIFIGTPVWASRPAPAVNTFLTRCDLKGKTVLLFACSGGETSAKCFELMKKRLHGGSVLGQIGFAQTANESATGIESRIKSWLSQY